MNFFAAIKCIENRGESAIPTFLFKLLKFSRRSIVWLLLTARIFRKTRWMPTAGEVMHGGAVQGPDMKVAFR